MIGTFINFSTNPVNLFTNAANPDSALHKHNMIVNGADVDALHSGQEVDPRDAILLILTHR